MANSKGVRPILIEAARHQSLCKNAASGEEERGCIQGLHAN